jgi:hypothetical protein
MSEEEKQLLLIDLSARLPYELKVQYKEKTYDLLGLDKGRIFVNIARIGEWLPTVYTFNIKPYLRPMSSMTEEEIHDTIGFPRKISIGTLRGWVDYTISNPDFVDWLNAHHFDYRGLIEKGLALEAPDGMYK